MSTAVDFQITAALPPALWQTFNDQAELPTDTLEYLQAEAQTAAKGIKTGFVIVRENGEPVVMAPYFIAHFTIDDGVSSVWIKALCRFAGFKHFLRRLALPFSPFGFKFVNIGSLHGFEGKVYSRSGNLVEFDRDEVVAAFRGALKYLQRKHWAPCVQTFRFADTPQNLHLFRRLKFSSYPNLPDTALNLEQWREAHRAQYDRLVAEARACELQLADLEREQADYKIFRQNFAHDLAAKARLSPAAVQRAMDGLSRCLWQSQRGGDDEKARADWQRLRDELSCVELETLLQEQAQMLIKPHRFNSEARQWRKRQKEIQAELQRLGSRELNLDNFSNFLSPNARSAFRRKCAEFDKPSPFITELVGGARALDLADDIYAAWRAQYKRSPVQGLPFTRGFFHRLLALPGTEALVLWYQDPTSNRRLFAGFNLFLQHRGARLSYRIGINDRFAYETAESAQKESLVWHRLILGDLAHAMARNAEFLRCGPTCYVLKGRYGFEKTPVVNAIGAVFPFRRLLDNAARKVSEHLVSPDVLNRI